MLVVPLASEEASDVSVTGAKAAALARAQSAGLPTLPGVVLSTEFTRLVDGGADPATHPAVRHAFEAVEGPTRPLVARSSSVVEDAAGSSMAGQFESVIGIEGFDDFVGALTRVLESRHRNGTSPAPMAVLCQPLLAPTWGGVLFGVDPVTGRTDRLVVNAVEGGPERLVNGEVAGSHLVLDDQGHEIEFEPGDGPRLPTRVQRQLVRLAAEAAATFGSPQDIEWAAGHDGEMWVLQSRPVTTRIRGTPRGPIYGPGPVAETFPEPLEELEVDLWVPPLRDAVREALRLTGQTAASRLEDDLVISVHGHVAIDLELTGEVEPGGRWRNLDPRRSARRLRSAWRVGRLRAAMPSLAEALLDRVDRDLEAVPPVNELTSRQLVALLRRGQVVLRALHAHEILMGMLTSEADNQMTGVSVAMRVLNEARLDGHEDEEIVSRSPVVLALTPPKVARAPTLPGPMPTLETLDPSDDEVSHEGILREALRLRVRWIHELTGRAAWQLGARLARVGALDDPSQIRHMTLDQIDAFATKRGVTAPSLVRHHLHDWGETLPARFRLSDRGLPIAVVSPSGGVGGTGAGGGIGRGPVTHDTVDPPRGSVLVTTTLSPTLAPLLTRLSGVVCETGSVLSHLAILAREASVPIVVGHPDAMTRLVDGTVVSVDGISGDVAPVTAGEDET